MEPMRKVRNVGIADLFVPTGMFDGVTIQRGEVGEVPARIADGLLDQPSNWVAADDPPKDDKPKASAESKPSAKRKADD